MKKKILRVLALIVILFIALLVAIPFFLEAKIGDLIRNNVNKNVNATLDFTDASLSLIKSFPNAQMSLEGVTLVNKAPFVGDTLFAAKDLDLTLGLGELFKSADEPIGVKSLTVDGASIYVKVNEAEVANYEIGKETGKEIAADESSEGFTLDLQSYAITNSKVVYDDRAAKVFLVVSDIQHNGQGDLSATTSELETQTEALVTFALDSINYLNKNKIQLDALIGIDLKEDKYTFLKNEALVNQLPLVFNGFVKVNEDSQEVDISFKTPSSDFKNFLAVIPEQYSTNIENVKTTGNFELEGEFKGIVDETRIPKFNIRINSDNASFKYPDLPKTVRNVFIDTKISNTSGKTEDTFVDIDRFSFTIDQDKFNMKANIRELMGNTKVDAHMDGNMNLANLSQAYPMPADLGLSGILQADVTTAFDMATLEKKQYEKTTTTGKLQLRDFEYNSEEMAHPVQLQNLDMAFNPSTVTLSELQGTTGQTDFNVRGTLDNLLGFLFNDERVEGNFKMTSDIFALNDFMTEESNTESAEEKDASDSTSPVEGKIEIPAFLDVAVSAAANTVIYDNLRLTDVKGNLRIKDQKAVLSNMTSSLFGGKVAFNGAVSTKEETPDFSMKLDMSQLGIGETFKSLEMFQALAPIAQVLQGKMDTQLELSGKLTNDFSPMLTSLTGNALANLMTEQVAMEKAPLLSTLDGKLDFLDIKDLNLKDLKTSLSFENGLVRVKPFTLNYKDIAINVGGGHTFDQKLDYKAVLQVPAKYLGEEVSGLIAQIDDTEMDNLTIPVTANIGGSYTSPTVGTDLTSGVKDLTAQLVEIQKQKLLNKGKEQASDLIGGLLSNNSKDSTQTNTNDGVKEVLGSILGGNKEEAETKEGTDSLATPEKDAVKETAKSILGGLLGKKKDTVK
ncbi:MAG: AsmA-like C-terminal region-containing protein [Bacteroidota bacterium]